MAQDENNLMELLHLGQGGGNASPFHVVFTILCWCCCLFSTPIVTERFSGQPFLPRNLGAEPSTRMMRQWKWQPIHLLVMIGGEDQQHIVEQ